MILVLCLCFAWCPVQSYAAGLLPGAVGTFLPGFAIGELVAGAFSRVDLGNFLSHAYDAETENARRWGGRIWNWLVDEDLCPDAYAQKENGGRHHFVYGYTQRDGVAGYYNYCEYCGQFTGDIIQRERPSGWGGIRGEGFNSIKDGSSVVYGRLVIRYFLHRSDASWWGQSFYMNDAPSYNITDSNFVNWQVNYNQIGLFINSYYDTKPFLSYKTTWPNVGDFRAYLVFPGTAEGYLFNYDKTFNLDFHIAYKGAWNFQESFPSPPVLGSDSTEQRTLSNTTLPLPDYPGNNRALYIGQCSPSFSYDNNTCNWYFLSFVTDIDWDSLYCVSVADNILISDQSPVYDTTYMTINAPISIVKNEGDSNSEIYVGLLSDLIDLNNKTLNLVNLGLDSVLSGELSFDSYTYNYDNSTVTFDLSSSDDYITFSYGDEYTEIDYLDDSGNVTENVELYYITNNGSPVYDVTIEDAIPTPTIAPSPTPEIPEITPTPDVPIVTNPPSNGGSGSGSGSGNISFPDVFNVNVEINYPETTVQVPIIADGQTQGVVTAPQNIPEGLYDIRESLAQGAGVIQEGSRGVVSFITDGFTFLPENIRYLIGVGITFSVAAGIWHAFKG